MRSYTILMFVLLILGAGGFYYVAKVKPLANQQVAAVISSGVTTPQTATSSAAIATSLTTTLSSASPNGVKAVVVGSQSVAAGTVLSTNHTGRGLIENANGSASILDFDTTMTVELADSSGTHIRNNINSGGVWARVQKVFGQGEFFELQTQNAVAVARGTSYGVRYQNHLSTVLVSQGKVGVIPIDPTTGIRQGEKEKLIVAGEKAIVTDQGQITVSSMTSADKNTPWFLFNNPKGTTTAVTSAVHTNSSVPSRNPHVEPPTTPLLVAPPPQPMPTPEPAVAPSPTPTPSGPVQTPQSTLTLNTVRPAEVVIPNTATLIGSGFTAAQNVIVGDVLLSKSDITIGNDSTITISTRSLKAGTWDVSVLDSYKHTATLRQALTVVEAPSEPPSGQTQSTLPVAQPSLSPTSIQSAPSAAPANVENISPSSNLSRQYMLQNPATSTSRIR